jgi:hypothetical protein
VEVARVAVDFALSIIRFALPIMSPVARYGYDGYKYARQWPPNVELTPGTIDWLHGMGSLAAGSIFGLENLSFPSLPSWLWVASVPGLLVFSSTRPNLLRRIWRTVCYVGRYLNHGVSIASEYARSHPRTARFQRHTDHASAERIEHDGERDGALTVPRLCRGGSSSLTFTAVETLNP